MTKILVIPSEKYALWRYNSNATSFADLLNDHGIYLHRDYAETNPDFLQIIPYVIVHRNNKEYFAYTRLKKGNESRLHGNISIGIGGHVELMKGELPYDNFTEYSHLEIEEELNISNYNSLFLLETDPPLFIYDTSNEVGKVHLGVVYTLNVKDEEVSIKETEKIDGKFYTLEEINTLQNRFENWTKIALEQLFK